MRSDVLEDATATDHVERLLIRPTFLGPTSVAIFVGGIFMNGGQFVVSYPDPMQALLIIGLLVFVVFAVAGHWLRIYFSWVEENFSLEETQSFCCSVNHSDESGNIIICDRKIIMTCIRSWFGSEEHFEASVRSDVFAACVQGLGRQAFPFSWYLGSLDLLGHAGHLPGWDGNTT
eukprot:g7924.t1